MTDKKNNPQVSVIMSVYKDKEFVVEAIESLLSQTYTNFEFLIINDASPDGSFELVKKFAQKDDRIKLFENEKNKGLTRSLNILLKKAKGKYIARMDADDIALPERFEKQVEILEKNNTLGLVGTWYTEINEKGEEFGKKEFPEDSDDLKKVLIKYNPFFHASVMFRKEVIEEIGVYDTHFEKAQDYDLWLRIAQKYEVTNIAKFLMKRRYTPGMISIKKENIQLKWALKARIHAFKRKQYPLWKGIYMIRPVIVLLLPKNIRKFLRKKLLGSKIYD